MTEWTMKILLHITNKHSKYCNTNMYVECLYDNLFIQTLRHSVDQLLAFHNAQPSVIFNSSSANKTKSQENIKQINVISN